MTDEEILKEEVTAILDDIRALYEKSGRKASGQFSDGLEAVYTHNSATIRGYVYLAGRGKTKKAGKPGEPTLQQSIKAWIKTKGIRPIKDNISIKSLAFLIARKIHKEGTDKSKWLKVYEQVITPERVDQILDRVAQINVNRIVTEIQIQVNVLNKNA